jgi:hypothetical protein
LNNCIRIEEVTKTTVPNFDGRKLEGLSGDEAGMIRFRVASCLVNVLEKGKVHGENRVSEVYINKMKLKE